MESSIEKILQHNKRFVENKDYERYTASKYPSKKLAILSCMDTRLTELLPAALNLKNGEAKIIKNAGGVITHPFGSVIRSLLVAIYELGVAEILVVGHDDCGMQGLKSSKIIDKMHTRGISKDTLNMVHACGIDLDCWLKGFDDVTNSVRSTVKMITSHPLIPKDITVYGLIMNPNTGEITLINE